MSKDQFETRILPAFNFNASPVVPNTPGNLEQLANSRTFISGEMGSFDWTYEPPEDPGFFETVGDRYVLKNLTDTAGFTGSYQISQDLKATAMGIETGSGLRRGIGFTVPYMADTNDADEILAKVDDEWSGEDRTNGLQPQLLRMMKKVDPDIQEKLVLTKNKHAFDYLVNTTLYQSQLLDELEAYDKNSMFGGWDASVASAVLNYGLLDEDTTRTLGFGTLLKGASLGVKALGSAGASRSLSQLGKVLPDRPALTAQLALQRKIGVKSAAVLEGAIMGVGMDVNMQTDAINTANAIMGDDQQLVDYSPGHTLGAAAVGGAIGYGVAAVIQRGLSRLGRNVVEEDLPDDIEGLLEGAEETVSFKNLARQTGDDKAMDNINTRLASLTVDDEEAASFGWAVSRELLEHNNRTVDELDDFVSAIEKKANDAGVVLDEGFMNLALESFLNYGADATKAATGSRRELNARLRKQVAEAVSGSETLEEAIDTLANQRLSRRVRRPAPDPQRQAAADEVNRLMREASKTKNPAKKAQLIGQARKLSDDSGLTSGAYYRVLAAKKAPEGSPSDQFNVLKEQVDNMDVEQSLIMAEQSLIQRRINEITDKVSPERGPSDNPVEAIAAAMKAGRISDEEAQKLAREVLDLSERSRSLNDELTDLDELMNLRTDEMVKTLDEIPMENATKRERVKVFNNPEQKARILEAAENPEAFRSISTRHAEFYDDLARREAAGDIKPEQMKIIRAIFAQVEPDALPRYGNFTTSDPKVSPGMSGYSARATTGRQLSVFVRPGDDFVQTLLHELLHVGLHSLPGLRGQMIRLHGKMTRSSRKLGKARSFLTKVLREEDQARGLEREVDEYVGYILASPDEFFAEFGARYILDSKFRRMMVEEINDPKNPIFKIAELLANGIAKFVPYIDEFDFGLNAKDTQRFFSAVDQAVGFKPIQRVQYITGRTADEKIISSLSFDASQRAGGLGERAFEESSAFKLLDDIAEAQKAGDTKKVDKLKGQMQRGYVTRKGRPSVEGDYTELSPKQKEEVINAAMDYGRESQAEVLTGTNSVVRLLSRNGLSRWINRVVTNQQGLVHTIFSKFREMRAMSHLFGAHQYGLSRIGGKPAPRNITGAKNWALREFTPVANSLRALQQKVKSEESFQEINQKVVSILSKGERTAPKGHPFQDEIQDVLDKWTSYMEMMQKRGVSNGTLTKAQDKFYLPLRLDPAKVRGREAEVVDVITRHFMRQFDSTDPDTPLNYQTMRDALKWFDQAVDSNGRPKGKFNVDKDVFPDGRLPKSLGELTEAQRTAYLKALREPLEELQGRTPVEASAENYVLRQLGEETFTGTAKDFNKLQTTRGRQPKSHKVPGMKPRRFTQEEVFLDNPEMGKFFITDLFELGHNYASVTGFRVHAQDVLDDFLGVKGVTWYDFLNTMEANIQKKFGRDSSDREAVKNGFIKYHEVLADLSGGLPRVDSGYETVSQYGADLARQAALSVYGSGIGQSILFVENMWSVFSKVHNPMDLFDNIATLLKAYTPYLRNQAIRDELGGTLMEARRFQNHAANRFITGSADSNSALSWKNRITAPWKSAYKTFTGQETPAPGTGGRVGAGIMRVAEGTATLAQEAGLNRFFNEAGWMVQSRAMKREMKRYLPRALKLAKDLQENPITAQTAEAAARQFKGRARKAGFGDRWDIARRFDQAGFLTHPDKLRNLDAISKNAGGKDFSFDRMTEWAIGQPKETRDELLNIVNDAANMVETEVMKRISEAQGLYKATGAGTRTFVGSLMNSMFSFARSFYGNTVLDAPGMPSRVFMGMLSSYIFFEILSSQLRAMLDGESLDTIRDRWENNAVGELASGASRVPMLGVYTGIASFGVNKARRALGDDEAQTFGYSPYQSAATGAMERLINLGGFMIDAPLKWATGQEDAEELGEEFWDQYRNIIPGVGSIYGEMLQRQLSEGN